MRTNLFYFLTYTTLFTASCGQTKDKRSEAPGNSPTITPITENSSFLTDSNVTQEAADIAIVDAMEALSDSNLANSSGSLTLLGDSVSHEKSCTANEDGRY